MTITRIRLFNIIITGVICLAQAGANPSSAAIDKKNIPIDSLNSGRILHSEEKKGYNDVINYEDKFLAIGTDGTIDYISKSGKITKVSNSCNCTLNSAICDRKAVIVAGNNGTILFSSDGENYNKIDAGTKKNIYSITSFNGILIASAEKGTLLVSMNGSSWGSINLNVKGDIVSVAANDSRCFGVTDTGEIIKSSDGTTWEIDDYNRQYAGYNRPCKFKRVLLTDNRIVIIGQHDDGTPVVLYSSIGNVWTERLLVYTDNQEIQRAITNLPNDVTYDLTGDQFFLACNNGEIVSLPSCSKCNKTVTVTGKNLFSIVCSGDYLISVGEDYYFNIMNLR